MKNIFNLVKEFFKGHDIDLSLIGSICTNGAFAMFKNRSGFATRLEKKVSTLKVTDCMINTQVPISKSMPKSMKDVLDTCIRMVNFIRKHGTSYRIFQPFCDKIGDEHHI